MNTQSVYRLSEGGELEPAGQDSFSESVAAMGLERLRMEIEAAETSIEAGTVTPQPRGPRP